MFCIQQYELLLSLIMAGKRWKISRAGFSRAGLGWHIHRIIRQPLTMTCRHGLLNMCIIWSGGHTGSWSSDTVYAPSRISQSFQGIFVLWECVQPPLFVWVRLSVYWYLSKRPRSFWLLNVCWQKQRGLLDLPKIKNMDNFLFFGRKKNNPARLMARGVSFL